MCLVRKQRAKGLKSAGYARILRAALIHRVGGLVPNVRREVSGLVISELHATRQRHQLRDCVVN